MLTIAAIAAVIYWYEWPRIDSRLTKEKIAFLAFLGLGVVLSVFLLFFPEAPGPTDLFDAIFRKLNKPFGLK